MMTENSLKGLYTAELQDLLSAEDQLVKTLPKVIEAMDSEELKQAVADHLEQTKEHVVRLKQVFELLGTKPEEKECQAMKGLLKEGGEIIDEFDAGAVRDAALIGACQRVEHYEIAAYGTTRAFAEILGYDEQADILNETLQEEAAADETLSGIAEGSVNPAAKELVMAGPRD